MLYDAYVVKMKRLVKIRNAIIKYRFLILALMLLTVAAVSTFLFSIGKVTITTNCQDEIVYGETLDFKAKAFMKKVTYEYKAGSGWSNLFPTTPGTHKVRAVSTGLLGKPKYSKTQDFTIKPKDVTLSINGYNYSYGDDIILSGNLVSGDTAKIVGFKTGITDVGRMTVNDSNVIIKIYNRNNEDVTKCYNITFVETDISVNKRPVIIDIKDAEKVYDGTPLTSEAYDITSGSFVNGDKLQIKFSSSITEVSSINNLPTVSVINENGNDVTHFYNIKINAGTLRINKATIEVTTGSKEFEYDGKDHEVLDYKIGGDFNTKYKGFTVDVTSNVVLKDVGTYDNKLILTIRDTAGVDVTSFFNIQMTNGKVEITKRNIQVVTGSTSTMYTGSNIDHKVIASSTGLLTGHTCEVLSDTNPNKINVGKHENKLSVKIIDESGSVVTGNYNISYTYGTVEVTKRPITVESTTGTYIYSGSNIHHKDFIISSSIGLADSDSASVATYTEILDVGTKKNELTIKIYNTLKPEIDCTNNYDIKYTYGDIIVNKRPIVLLTGTIEHVYDDTDYKYEQWDLIGEYRLPNGHVIKASGVPTIKYVGNIENRFSVDILDYKGDIVTKNYDIQYEYGTVTVIQRPVVFKTKNIEKEYDNTILTDGTHELVETPNLVEGHKYYISAPFGSILNVGEVENTLTVTKIVDANNKDVTSNYDIQYEFGWLKINPRKVTILSLSTSKTYDGQSLTYPKSIDKDGRLVKGHTHTATGFVSVTDAGEYENEFTDCYIYDQNGLDVTYNYEITKEFGTLTINKRPISVDSYDATKMYDGYNIYNRDCSVSSGSLVSGHNIEVTESTEFKGAYTMMNVFFKYLITDANGNDVTSNYDVSQNKMGTLTITKRPIKFRSASNEFAYDGKVHYDDTYTIISEYGLADTDSVINVVPTYVKDVGTYTNVLKYEIDNFYSDKGTENYIISSEAGQLVVYPKDITIKPEDVSLVYDGKLHGPTDVEFVSSALCENHTYEVTFLGGIKNVGTVETSIVSFKIFDELSVDVTSNYNITYQTGFIEITPKEITITSESLEKAYDGTPLTSLGAGYTISEVFDGFEYNLSVEEQSITNVGSVEYQHYVDSIIDSDGEIATSNFIIKYVKGTLTILPRKIKVVTGNYEKVYDGTPLRAIDFEPIEEIDLVENHQIFWSDDYATITDVGEVENKRVIDKICDEEFNDVTSNYEIEYQYGTLKILAQIITILTGTQEKVYDDTPLYCLEYEILSGKFINGDYLEIIDSTYALYYSETPVENILEFQVIDKETNLPSNNYKIVCQYGTLQILKRPLEVTTPDLTFVYTSKNVENIDYDIINPENLVAGQTHSAHRDIEIINVGTYFNLLNIDIYNAEGINVAFCYDITCNAGTITITPRVIEIVTGSASKLYDGDPLYCEEYTSTSIYPAPEDYGIGENDHLVITSHTEIVHVGTAANVLGFYIENIKGEDVTSNYECTETHGLLEIFESGISDTPDAVIVFDNLNKRTEYSYYSKQVWEENGITVTNKVTSSSSYMGNYYNPVRFYRNQSLKVEYEEIKAIKIYYANYISGTLQIEGATVQKNNYIFTIVFDEVVTEFEIGYLPFQMNVTKMEIFKGEKKEDIEVPDKDKTFDSIFNTSGNLSSGGGGGGAGGGDPIVVFKFTSSASDLVYFRLKSFGNYVTTEGFIEAPNFDFASYAFNPIYLTSKILEENGYDANSISVVVVLDKTPYLLPCYGLDASMDGTDSILDKAYDGSYSLEYIDFNILNSDTDFVESIYSAYEQAYREYVYDTYLQVPDNLKAVLNKHIKLAKLDINSPSVINDLVTYVKYLKPYDSSVKYPSGVDHVLYFLETATGGICQQFAATATMMFRQLGIPARYTIGFVGFAEAGQEVEVTSNEYHAWVEIYIDGLGWVIVDPTGNGGASTPNPDDPNQPKVEINIKPLDRMKQYDGTPLYPYNFDDINVEGITQLIEGLDDLSKVTLQNLFSEGYTYDISISGEQTSVGVSESNIVSFTLFDPTGVDVTDDFIINYSPGKLEVVNQLVELRFYNQIKYYSGTAYSYTEDMIYKVTGLPEEYQSFTYTIVGSITNVGELKAEITNVKLIDKYGNDITSNYDFNCIGKIEVRQRILILRTQSADKKYDGEPLTNNVWWIRLGELVEGDKITVVMDSSITNVGEIYNEISQYTIVNSEGVDITLNYNVIREHGELVVTN